MSEQRQSFMCSSTFLTVNFKQVPTTTWDIVVRAQIRSKLVGVEMSISNRYVAQVHDKKYFQVDQRKVSSLTNWTSSLRVYLVD